MENGGLPEIWQLLNMNPKKPKTGNGRNKGFCFPRDCLFDDEINVLNSNKNGAILKIN